MGSALVSLLCQQHTLEAARNEKLPAKGKLDNMPGWGELTSCCSSSSSGVSHGNSQLGSHCKLLSAFLCMTGSGRTLRETVLESSPILALLNESFISSWSLVKELEELQVSAGATSAFFVFGAGEHSARRCWQEGRAHTCTNGGSKPSVT